MKKKILLLLSLFLCVACQNGDTSSISTSDTSSEDSNYNLLQKYYHSESHKVEFSIVQGLNSSVPGYAIYTPNGVYTCLTSGNQDYVVGYAEDDEGIFDFVLVNNHVRPTSIYYSDTNGENLKNLYDVVPSLKIIDEEVIDAVELSDGVKIQNVDDFAPILEIGGLDSSELTISSLNLYLDENDSLTFVFTLGLTLSASFTFLDLNNSKIADLDAYLSSGGGCDLTSFKVNELMSTYNYVCYLYDENDALYAVEYYNEEYYFTDYADPNEQDDGYLGIPGGKDKVSGIYHFTYDGNNILLDDTPTDITSNHLKNVFTYPSDLNLLKNLPYLEYSALNDAYISTDFMDAVEVAQIYGLEDYVNILSPYCSAVQFTENKENINQSKVGIWYVYSYGDDIGIYAKEFTDFGSVKLDFIENFLKSFN